MWDDSREKIFAGNGGKRFAKKMCEYIGCELGESKAMHFSDGNIFVKVQEPIRNKDVFLVQPIGNNPNDEFVELLFWIDAFKRSSANTVTAVLPYFGYAKGDKKDEPRVSIRARVCAESIELAGADRIITMDLHSAQVQGFFKKPVDHLYSTKLLGEYIKRTGIVNEDLVIVSPDAGYAKQARIFADHLKVPVAIGEKMRSAHDENAKVLNIIGEVEGKNCLIVDDFTISGGTIIDTAKSLKQKGANKIFAALSHIILKDEGVDKIDKSSIEWIVSTDTVECPAARKSNKIRIISAAPFFGEVVKRLADREPLGEMFDHIPERVFETSFASQINTLKNV